MRNPASTSYMANTPRVDFAVALTPLEKRRHSEKIYYLCNNCSVEVPAVDKLAQIHY